MPLDDDAVVGTTTTPRRLFDAETNAAVADRLFKHIDEGTTDLAPSQLRLDPAVYSDPALAALEQERIFDRCPVIVAHSSEVANAHDFVTVDLPGNQVLVVRQPDGSIRAFVNVCRHRGSCLVDEPAGNRRVLACPYHGWCYNSDGGLRSITYPETFGEIDRSEFGLVRLPAEERHGLIWVVQRPGAAPEVAGWLGPEMDDVLAAYSLEDYHCDRVTSFEEVMNWKVATDAFVDGYHLKFAHPQSVGPHFYTNVQLFSDFGRHARWIVPRKRIDRIRFEPAGTAAVDPYVTVGHFLMPNTTLLRQPDHFQVLTFVPHPTDPTRSRMDVRLLVAEPVTTEADRQLWDRNFEILLSAVVDEDLPLNRRLQTAVMGRGVAPLIVGRNEPGNQLFHREWARALAE
jgi:phenylpropionate dioxygenase-like ring-hydroxylating dioxygenase large terminal subunit